ncbi:hypothetical protein GCM10022245_66080 [Streptomyces mayteni]
MRDGDEHDGLRQWAEARDGASIFQAGRDLHVVYVADVRAARRAAAAPAHAGECPYPGLASFEEADARWFHGRDALIAEILVGLDARLSVAPPGPLIVVAPSGAGKSTLLRAAVLPALARAAPDRPRAAVRTPGARPLDVPLEPDAALVVDQLEELFTLCEDEAERVAFLDRLQEHARRAPVICALRSDFYARAADHAVLRTALATRQVVVGPLTDDGLREAITRPAAEVGLDVEPGLVELLVDELGHAEAGRLPLLAHALRATWQQREGSVLTVDGYRATGGIRRAVATTAETTYAALDSDATRAAARTLFLRLTRIGADGTDDTRRPLPATDLDPAALDAFTAARLLTRDDDTVTITHEALLRAWPRLREWIDEDRADRLVRQQLEEAATDWDRAGRDPDLLWTGNRLAAAESSPVDRLSATATAFRTAAHGRARRATRLRRGFTAFVAVLAVLALGAAYVANQQASTAEAERDTARFRQVTATAEELRESDPSLAAQFDLVAQAMRPDDPGTRSRLLDNANSVLSTPLVDLADPVFNRAAGLLAAFTDDTVRLVDISGPPGREPPRTPLPGDPGNGRAMAFSPDGTLLVTTHLDDSVRLWDVGDPARPALLGGPVTASIVPERVMFGPSGEVFVTVSGDGPAQLWSVTGQDRPSPLGDPLPNIQEGAWSAEFSEDGRLLAARGTNGTVQVWDVTTPTRPTALGEPLTREGTAVAAMAFSPDGSTLVTGDDMGAVQTWDVTGGGAPESLDVPVIDHLGGVSAVAFLPDGQTFVTGGADGGLAMWDLDEGRMTVSTGGPSVPGHLGGVDLLAPSPDGPFLASASAGPMGSAEASVRLWVTNATGTGPVPFGPPLTGDTMPTLLAWSADGRTLVAGDDGGIVRLWRVPATMLTDTRLAGADMEQAIGPDGDTLTFPTLDGLISWDMSDPGQPEPLSSEWTWPTESSVWSLALSPDDATMATLDLDGTLELWDVSDSVGPVRRSGVRLGEQGVPDRITWSPDGTTLALSNPSYDAVQLWDVRDLSRPTDRGVVLAARAEAVSAAFTPDSQILAVGGGYGEEAVVRLWAVGEGQAAPEAPLGEVRTDDVGGVSAMGFTQDGRTLVTGGGGGGPGSRSTLRLWDLTDPSEPDRLGEMPDAHGTGIRGVAVSPADDSLLASLGDDGQLRLWDIREPEQPRPYGQPLGGDTVELAFGLAYAPDGDVLVTRTEDNLRIWVLDPDSNRDVICDATRGALTPEVWERHLPDLPYRPPCEAR